MGRWREFHLLFGFILMVLTLALDTGSFIQDREQHPQPGQAPPPPGRILAVALGPLILGVLLGGACVLVGVLGGDRQPYDPAKLAADPPVICRPAKKP